MKLWQAFSVAVNQKEYCPNFNIDWQYKTCRCRLAQRQLPGTIEFKICDIEPCTVEDMKNCEFLKN